MESHPPGPMESGMQFRQAWACAELNVTNATANKMVFMD
jgi:hypothetical protein